MEAASAPAGRLRVLDALRHRDFRLLFVGQAVSLIGDAAFLTALGWRTFTLAGTSRFGLVLVCQSTALLATLLIGGALADRYPRRTLMIVSDVARFAAVAGLAAVDASGHLSFASLLALATLMGFGDGFFYPAFGGIVPQVVEPQSLPSANSLIGVARWSSRLVGPSLAALVYGAAGSATISRSTPPRSSSRRRCSRSPVRGRSSPRRARARSGRFAPAGATSPASPGSG